MRLAHISWKKAESYFQHSDMAIIAVGSNECHGKHIALGTDTLVPDHLLALIEERRPDILIAPTVPYGACDDLLGYAGTISLGAELLTEVMTKITDALYNDGIRRFVLLNGHGGNIHSLDRVGCALHRRGAWCAMLNWWKMAGEINPAWAGGHGGGEETAAVMAVNPSFVDRNMFGGQELVNDLGDTLPTIGFDYIRYKGVSVQIPRDVQNYAGNGWIGPDHPKDATVEWGREMLAATADYIVDFLGEFEKIPLPHTQKECDL